MPIIAEPMLGRRKRGKDQTLYIYGVSNRNQDRSSRQRRLVATQSKERRPRTGSALPRQERRSPRKELWSIEWIRAQIAARTQQRTAVRKGEVGCLFDEIRDLVEPTERRDMDGSTGPQRRHDAGA
jgi:hypothetical protein